MLSLDQTDPTPLQKQVFREYRSGRWAEIALDGPVRQGKSGAMVICLVDMIAGHIARNVFYDYGMLGATILALNRNLGRYFEDASIQYGLSFEDIGGSYPHWSIGGRRMFKFNGETAASERKIRGATVHSGGVDEITKVHYTAHDTFVDRFSFDGGVLFTTCNPDRPLHWYRHGLLTAPPERRVKSISVPWRDNQHYSDERAAILESRDPSTAAYKRNVLGQWVEDSGLIVPLQPEHFVKDPEWSGLGICVMDEGLRGTQAAQLWIPYGKQWLIADEYYWQVTQKGYISADQHVTNIREIWDNIATWVVDPAAGTTKDALARQGLHVINAKTQDFARTVDRTNEALHAGRLVLDIDKTPNTQLEHSSVAWVQGANRMQRPDRPDRGMDHLFDCTRMGGMHNFAFGVYWD